MPPHLLNQLAHTTQYLEYKVNNRINVIFHTRCLLDWQKHKRVTMGETLL